MPLRRGAISSGTRGSISSCFNEVVESIGKFYQLIHFADFASSGFMGDNIGVCIVDTPVKVSEFWFVCIQPYKITLPHFVFNVKDYFNYFSKIKIFRDSLSASSTRQRLSIT